MFKKNWNGVYFADTKEDLAAIKDEIGAKALVIKDNARYQLMSTGEWVKQVPAAAPSTGEVDLTGYATEAYVDEKVENVLDNPVFDIFGADNVNNPKLERYGIYVKAADNKSIVEVMQEKGLGFWNFFVQKGSKDMPKKMASDNTSGHGICCVDYYVRVDEWAGYVLMFNKNNECYFRYISHGVAGPWMQMAATEE